ncbi:unnamed protein product [Brachionus calyciflorus]|uniref:NADH dehydrogenase [ubiquinone] 1 beta subcomplex subunit 10 n=1 Tax=Brachionus calyciflorus TaxID=104777 RepID=A0A814GWZ6_9BILA|nr:unnamed protein product [Brachionus calyciflorus]
MSHGEHHGEASGGENKFMNRLVGVTKLFDGPATFFREKFVDKVRKDYPYYHRNYPRVPSIDECAYGDHVCFYEANEQYLRDRKVDKFITQLLANRVRECYINEGQYDGFDKCRKLDDDYEKALTNYYIKYGDLGANSTAIDAYMKQKHRLIWQRRNPEKDIVGLDKQNEIRKEIAEYQKKSIDNPIRV